MHRLAVLVLIVACGPEFPASGPDASLDRNARPMAPSDQAAPWAPERCREWLDAYGVSWRNGSQRPGIADPILVTPPIAGIGYQTPSGQPRGARVVDCELALALARSAAVLQRHAIIAVRDFGIYSYRCLANQGTPPDCDRGLSQHAFGRAIDVAAYVTHSGDVYSVESDWLADEGDTCAGPWSPGPNATLHQILCEQIDAGLWSVVLTPNYNQGHRDHFHLDRSEDGDFVRRVSVPRGGTETSALICIGAFD